MQKKNARLWSLAKPYAVTFLAILLFGLVWLLLLPGLDKRTIQGLMVLGIAPLAAWGALRLWQKKLTFNQAVALVFAIGLIMRLGYTAYTPLYARQHDMGDIYSTGHIGYAFHFAQTLSLPAGYSYQLYHPPLHYFIAGQAVRLCGLLGASAQQCVYAVELLGVFYTGAALIVCYRIVRQLELSSKAAFMAFALLCLHPNFYVTANGVNNDMLMLLFFLAALLYAIKWYKKPTRKYILVIAVCMGCSMMAKISGALLAPVLGGVFIAKWAQKNRGVGLGRLWGQFGAFLLAALPLGLWHPVRSLVRLGQPLGYVPDLGAGTALYCGDSTVLERILPLGQARGLYCRPFGDYNIPAYILRCSVFGEYAYEGADVPGAVLLGLNAALILASLGAMVYLWVRARKGRAAPALYFFSAVWAVVMLAYISFCFKMPYGCSMDFRYIMPTLLCGAVLLAFFYDELPQASPVKGALAGVSACFCAAGIWMFVSI